MSTWRRRILIFQAVQAVRLQAFGAMTRISSLHYAGAVWATSAARKLSENFPAPSNENVKDPERGGKSTQFPPC